MRTTFLRKPGAPTIAVALTASLMLGADNRTSPVSDGAEAQDNPGVAAPSDVSPSQGGLGPIASNSAPDPPAADPSAAPPPAADPAVQPPPSTLPITVPGPLTIKIGDSYLTPFGFIDVIYTGRSTNVGSGIGTNFASIPFINTPAGHDRWFPKSAKLAHRRQIRHDGT